MARCLWESCLKKQTQSECPVCCSLKDNRKEPLKQTISLRITVSYYTASAFCCLFSFAVKLGGED